MSEAEFQRRVVAIATHYGWQTMHVRKGSTSRPMTTTSIPGWPDLVLWRPGRILYRELKLDATKLKPHQKAVLASLDAAGADTGVWRPRDLPAIVAELETAA